MRHEFGGIVVAGIDERGDAGDEKYQIQHEIERGLRARPHRAVEEVAADVGVLRQRVGPAEHEQRAVEHVVEVEDPRRRRVHDVALEDFDAHDGHQRDDQPGRGLADPGADAVDRVQKPLDAHALRPFGAEPTLVVQSTIRSCSRMVLCRFQCDVRSSSLPRWRRNSDRTPCARFTTVSCSHCVARLANASCDSRISLNSGFSPAFFFTTSS